MRDSVELQINVKLIAPSRSLAPSCPTSLNEIYMWLALKMWRQKATLILTLPSIILDSSSFEEARWTAAMAMVLPFFGRSLKKVITLIFVRRDGY